MSLMIEINLEENKNVDFSERTIFGYSVLIPSKTESDKFLLFQRIKLCIIK
jgi:hypothetical protein